MLSMKLIQEGKWFHVIDNTSKRVLFMSINRMNALQYIFNNTNLK